jgi:hypothetical protein
MSIAKTSLAVVAGTIALIAVAGGFKQAVPVPAQKHGNRSQEILAGCEREFGAQGIDRVRSCATEIMLREMQERDAAAIDRAAG